jgi:hypothetical protein
MAYRSAEEERTAKANDETVIKATLQTRRNKTGCAPQQLNSLLVEIQPGNSLCRSPQRGTLNHTSSSNLPGDFWVPPQIYRQELQGWSVSFW